MVTSGLAAAGLAGGTSVFLVSADADFAVVVGEASGLGFDACVLCAAVGLGCAAAVIVGFAGGDGFVGFAAGGAFVGFDG
ncbi:MAG TPA: hypothetical protein VGL13_15875 [Polyangiaceae bacterium]